MVRRIASARLTVGVQPSSFRALSEEKQVVSGANKSANHSGGGPGAGSTGWLELRRNLPAKEEKGVLRTGRKRSANQVRFSVRETSGEARTERTTSDSVAGVGLS